MELPELTILAKQMQKEIAGRQISAVEVANPKCLNIPFEQFKNTLIEKTIKSVKNHGK